MHFSALLPPPLSVVPHQLIVLCSSISPEEMRLSMLHTNPGAHLADMQLQSVQHGTEQPSPASSCPASHLQIKRMQMEARSFSQDKSQQLLRKVKDYQADLRKISDDFKQAQGGGGGGAAARAELGLSDNYYDTSAGERWGQAGHCRRQAISCGRVGQTGTAAGRQGAPQVAGGRQLCGAVLSLSCRPHDTASAGRHVSHLAAQTCA